MPILSARGADFTGGQNHYWPWLRWMSVGGFGPKFKFRIIYPIIS